MKQSDYFISPATPWDSWDSTTLSDGDYHFVCTSASQAAYRSQYSVEKKYPGFTSVYKILVGQGCDACFVTSVMKFCLINADEEQVDTFFEDADILKVVQLAMTIGLSGADLVAHLQKGSNGNQELTLPCDIIDCDV